MATNGRTIIKDAVAKCPQLTDKFVDVDNEIASTHSIEFDEVLPFEVINQISQRAKTSAGVIGFDGYGDPAGNVHVFKRGKYNSPVSLEIEEYNRSRDSHRIRNKIKVYGAPDIKDPPDEDTYTDYSDPASHNWSSDSGSGTISADSTEKKQGDRSVKHHMTVAGVENKFSFDLHAEQGYYIDGKWVKHEFRQLRVWLRCSVDCDFVANGLWIRLLDKDGHYMDYMVEGPKANVWRSFIMQLGHNAPGWHGMSAFDWDYIAKIQFIFYHASAASDAWADWLFFSGKRYRATASDSASIGEYGTRWAEPQTFDELKSDDECELKAKSLVEYLKEEVESFRTVRVEGSHFTPGDLVHVIISNDGINAWYRIVEVTDIIEGMDWTTQLKLSNEPKMIDYIMLRKAQVIVQVMEEARSGAGAG